MAVLQVVVFKINGDRFGINIDYVNGIEREQKIMVVPNAAESVKGIINLRGEVVPVIDLKAKFGRGYNENTNSELIIINLLNGRMALEVDKVFEIYDLEKEDLADMPAIAKGDGVRYFERVAKIKNELIILVHPHKLLTEIESNNINEIIDEAKETAAKEAAEKEAAEKEAAEKAAAEKAAAEEAAEKEEIEKTEE